MQQPSVIKSFVSGTAGGTLGASLALGLMGVAGGLDLNAMTYVNLLYILLAGAGACFIQALTYAKLPKAFVAQVILATTLFTALTWVGVFPQIDLEFSPKLALVSGVAGVVYGVVASFVLHHAIGLALPHVPMARRAEEFSDNPSGA